MYMCIYIYIYIALCMSLRRCLNMCCVSLSLAEGGKRQIYNSNSNNTNSNSIIVI